MNNEDLPGRVVRTGLGLAVFLVAVFLMGRRPDIAWGLAVGGALSLASFGTLAWMVPRLVQPGKRRVWLLSLAFLLKLPLYGVVLYGALASQAVSGGAVFAGVALVPAVITLKTVGQLLGEAWAAHG